MFAPGAGPCANAEDMSDIAHGMVLPPGGYDIKADEFYLKLNPHPLGPRHDEREPGQFGACIKWAEVG